MIELKAVQKIYGKKKNAFTALKSIGFKIPSGISVAIVGKSGSGKSTLMHVMSGLDRPTSGQVLVDGKDIWALKPREIDDYRAHKISFIFQSFFVEGNETCYDNVSLPLETAKIAISKRKNNILASLKAVELADKQKEKAKNLSGGQKQRLAIARAIATAPKILFADEPTGNLDSATGKIVEDLLFNYSKKRGATLIIVTHDTDLAKKCDMQIYIKDGGVEKVVMATEKPAKRGTSV